MTNYIANVKEHVVGQGVVMEISGQSEHFPPPPSPEMLDQLGRGLETKALIQNEDSNFPPPPPLPAKPKTSLTGGALRGDGTFYARPLNPPPVGPKPYGSTSSSLDSSRNNTPSPTSSNEDAQQPVGTIVPNLTRPGAFAGSPTDRTQLEQKRDQLLHRKKAAPRQEHLRGVQGRLESRWRCSQSRQSRTKQALASSVFQVLCLSGNHGQGTESLLRINFSVSMGFPNTVL